MPRERLPSTILNPLTFSSQDRMGHLEDFHEQAVLVNKELTLMQPEIHQKINIDGEIQLVPIGDTHLFSIYTNLEAVKRTLALLEKPNAFGFVTGDFIEAQHPYISEHVGSVELPTGKQIIAAADYLRPYFYAGKLLCTVDGFFGHDGNWSLKYGGIPAVEFMSRIMPLPDTKDPKDSNKWRYLPVLNHGGLLRLHLRNGREYVIKLFHDPNSGGSDNINRQGGLKTQFLNEDDDLFLDEGVHADLYIAGHQHHRSVVSKEIYFDRMSRKEKSVVFVQIGTSKGIDKDNQDPFLAGQGKGPTIGPGPVILLNQVRGNANGSGELTKEFVTYGYENIDDLSNIAAMKHKVEDFLNSTERQHLTQELLETVIDRAKKPIVEFNIRGSGRSPKERPGRAPLFDELKWEITDPNSFPILVYLLQNARYGSSSHEGIPYKNDFDNILDQATKNPFKYILAMRHFIDKGVSQSFDRREILEEMTDDLGPISEQKRLLGFMLSSTLLDAGWQKDVTKHTQVWNRSKKKWISEKEVDEGFRPGDEMYYKSAIKGTPLYVNESIMYVTIEGVTYSFFILDKLGRSGSEFNLVQGQVQSRKKEHVTADVTTGGHMPLAGFSIYPPRPRLYVAPGGFSNWDAGGKGNDKRVAVGGQAVILLSDKKSVLAGSNLYETMDMFNYLLLHKGLTEEEKAKLSGKSSR